MLLADAVEQRELYVRVEFFPVMCKNKEELQFRNDSNLYVDCMTCFLQLNETLLENKSIAIKRILYTDVKKCAKVHLGGRRKPMLFIHALCSVRWCSTNGLPLAYKTYFGRHDSSKGSLIILHGLFGHKGNWRSLSAALSQKLNRKVFAVDLRNHGDSPHHWSMTVPEMADDVIALIKDLNIAGDQLGIIGHSMGGKVAAHLALRQPSLLGKLLLEDMIPKRIDQPQEKVLLCIKALNQCELPQMDLTKARKIAYQQLFSVIQDAETTHFLLTSLMLDKHGKPVWKFNISAIENNLQEMFFYEVESKNMFEGPTFVVHGKRSDYVKPADVPFMLNFFPKLRFQCIAEAGHWVHTDRPSEFLSAAVDFFRR
ncbi:Alpha/beta hydrolase domain-containing protein 11 [Trichinella patagoniensis]|uniref:sn-1-specific diacylglycerol lipase ABHD11 n=1 Tax=Trichinella patagoniensis TaxID=990121 RepID=A0A0V1AGX1_9BILA|nr:Alpha/beta hydrolase domain-containing protein 11 [Trichinella patagoniensis]